MSGDTRKKLTFDGFMMGLSAEGTKDSEGFFTLAARETVKRLKEQFSADRILGYTEILQGFQELGAQCVELDADGFGVFTLSARFAGDGPSLKSIFDDPLNILAAKDCLQSGTGLLLLQHDQDQVVWSVDRGRGRRDHIFDIKSGRFKEVADLEGFFPAPRARQLGTTWLQLQVRADRRLAVFESDPILCWAKTRLSREFTNRLAFYGIPLSYRGIQIQCPLPGRLVPTDHWSRSPVGGMGYNWIPLAYHYMAAEPDAQHYFLSEPFTGIIADKVRLRGEVLAGYGLGSKPDYVSLAGCSALSQAPSVPFKRRWWHKSQPLAVPGFRQFSQRIPNPRMEPPLFRSHPEGQPLVCSRILMLSTALSGPSTLVFVKHGIVLGARHEDLGVPGSLCVLGLSNLTTDLSRRSVRKNQIYEDLVSQVRAQMLEFHRDSCQVIGF